MATVGERANWETVERYGQRQGQPHDDLRQLRMFWFCDTPQLAAGSFILNNVFNAQYVETPYTYSAYNQFGAPRHVIGMVRMTF